MNALIKRLLVCAQGNYGHFVFKIVGSVFKKFSLQKPKLQNFNSLHI